MKASVFQMALSILSLNIAPNTEKIKSAISCSTFKLSNIDLGKKKKHIPSSCNPYSTARTLTWRKYIKDSVSGAETIQMKAASF